MSFSSVASNFFAHLSDIQKNPSMQFAKGSTPVKALTNHYLIGNTAGQKSCYIISHGGHSHTDYWLDNMSFNVPTGVQVLFFHDHGDNFSYSYNKFGTGDPGDLPMIKISDGKKVYQAGDACQNYFLTKFQGRGGANESYQDLQNLAAPGNHLFVIVRNRWHTTGVTLKDTIKAVRAELPGIVQFNCMFCRNTDTTDTWYSATNRVLKQKVNGNWVQV